MNCNQCANYKPVSERFEAVKREKEREGQRFEGDVEDVVPEGMMLVYAGERRPAKKDEPRVGHSVGRALVFGRCDTSDRNPPERTILRLVPDPNYKPKPAFKAGDWVVNTGECSNGRPVRYVPELMNRHRYRPARLSDFEHEVNGTTVLLQRSKHGGIDMVVKGGGRTKHSVAAGEALARFMGLTIAPAGLE